MREYKKLWSKDKRFYLITVLILTLFALIYFGKNMYQAYEGYKEIVSMEVDFFNKVKDNLEEYIEKEIITERYYEDATIEIDNERYIKVWNWNDWAMIDAYEYRGFLIVLFVIQSLRFYLYDSKRGREFVDTLPVKKRSRILYEWITGILLYTIPMIVSAIPIGFYTYKAKKLVRENHGYIIKNPDLNSHFMFAILTSFVSILLIYSLFILMRYLTNSLAANYVVGALFFSTPYAVMCILESFKIYSSNYEKFSGLEAVLNGLSNFVDEFPWAYSQVNVGRLIMELLLAILFIVIAIVFTEKCKKEVNGMFAHKAVKVLFLIVIYFWSYILIYSSAENVSLVIMTVLSVLGSAVITAGAGYLVRVR